MSPRTLRFSISVVVALLLGMATPLFDGLAWASDGIPGNCENAQAAHYQANAFPRYEPHNRRLMLVDWGSGADIRALEINLDIFQFAQQSWSPDCRYLVGLIGAPSEAYPVIWDAVEGRRVGQVESAAGHHFSIRWNASGTAVYALVEAPTGATLHHIFTGAQFALTTDWGGWPPRNFKSLRWDDARNLLDAVTVNEVRVVYDLATGAVVTEAIKQAEREERGIEISAPQANCDRNRSAQRDFSFGWYRSTADAYLLRYDRDTGTVFLDGYDGAIRQTFETGLQTPSFSVAGWSATCRYIVASAQRPDLLKGGTKVFDTVVYDVVAQRRAMSFEDARSIPHPIIFHPTLDIVIIQTRHGGFLWNLASDARVLMTTGFAAQSGYYNQSIRNFNQLEWDLARGQILTVTVDNPAAITAFDFAGNQVGFVELDGARDARFDLHNGSDYIVITEASGTQRAVFAVWVRQTGVFTQLNPGFPRNSRWSTHISPDGRYLVATVITRGTRVDTQTGRNRHATYRAFYVWDFENLKSDFTANTISGAATYWPWWSSVSFKSSTILQTNDSQWDILTGNMLYEPATYAPSPITSERPGAMGIRFGIGYGTNGYYPCQNAAATHNLYVHHDGERLAFKDAASHEIALVVSDNDPQFREGVDWSPGCRYVFFRLSGENDGQERLEIWDAETLQPIPLPFPKFTLYNWSPDGEQVILRVETGSGYSGRTSLSIWQPKTGALTQLAENPITYYANQVFWDYARGQILMGQSYGFEVYAFDLSTGQLRNRYRGSSAYTGYYVNTEAGRGRGDFNVFGGRWLYIRGNNALTLFNLDTGENQQVWVAQGIVNSSAIAISPDGRYLAIGHDGFRVWDLSALAVDVEARTPQLYAGPVGRNNIQGLRFVSDTLIEITTVDGAVSRWDVTTGAAQP